MCDRRSQAGRKRRPQVQTLSKCFALKGAGKGGGSWWEHRVKRKLFGFLVFQIIEITTYLSLHEDDAVERGELMLAGTCRNLCPGWQEHRAVGALVEAWGGWESKPTILDCGGRAACGAPLSCGIEREVSGGG